MHISNVILLLRFQSISFCNMQESVSSAISKLLSDQLLLSCSKRHCSNVNLSQLFFWLICQKYSKCGSCYLALPILWNSALRKYFTLLFLGYIISDSKCWLRDIFKAICAIARSYGRNKLLPFLVTMTCPVEAKKNYTKN